MIVLQEEHKEFCKTRLMKSVKFYHLNDLQILFNALH